MAELLSVGLDVGTTTSQMVVSRLQVENRASAFSVPKMEIVRRDIIYKGMVQFTPLLGKDRVDTQALRSWLEKEYENAGITPSQVDTGAVIITGETSRKENARAVLEAISNFAGEFVVTTAGPHLESVLAAKGAGADSYSQQTGKTVLHMDIGGGTANLAWIENGRIVKTGCLNVGGRLVKLEGNTITYVSPVLQEVTAVNTLSDLEPLAKMLSQALEMAAGLRPRDALLDSLWTKEAGKMWEEFLVPDVISFSGGVADCIEKDLSSFVYGDIGPILGKAIGNSLLCRGAYRLGEETIRATVIGAGCHSTQLSGSTVFYQNVKFPLKNLPVTFGSQPMFSEDEAAILFLTQTADTYAELCVLADRIVEVIKDRPMYVAMEADMAKALGHALQLRLSKDHPILCIDRVSLEEGSYLDVAAPVGPSLPVVVKTLVLAKKQ